MLNLSDIVKSLIITCEKVLEAFEKSSVKTCCDKNGMELVKGMLPILKALQKQNDILNEKLSKTTN